MSDNEIEDIETTPNLELEVKEVKETKPKKKRKPMSEEHKAKLLKSLEKARIQSALKRGKKAKAKQILKEQDDDEVDKILDLHIKSKEAKENIKDKEIKRLQAKLDNLTLQDVLPKKPKSKPLPKIEEEPTEDDIGTVNMDKEIQIQKSVSVPAPIHAPKFRTPIRKPIPAPVKPQKRIMIVKPTKKPRV
jgi:hypothetical protein|tara:strand:- start:989 stop:1558 length:570 start_codon:yes stop_codon:yes gene_type:complete